MLALRLKPPPVWRERSNVLHDKVVLVGVDTDVCIRQEAEVHDVAEDVVSNRIAGDTMNNMKGLRLSDCSTHYIRSRFQIISSNAPVSESMMNPRTTISFGTSG